MKSTFLTFLFTVALASCTNAQPKIDAPPPDLAEEPVALIHEAGLGHDDNVKACLKKGEKVDQMDLHGLTALMVAARKGHVSTMELLLSAHSDPSLADEQGSTVLHYAILGNHPPAVALLLSRGAKVNVKDGLD